MITELSKLLLDNRFYFSKVKIPQKIYREVMKCLTSKLNAITVLRMLLIMEQSDDNKFLIIGNNEQVIVSSKSIKDCISILRRIDSLKVML